MSPRKPLENSEQPFDPPTGKPDPLDVNVPTSQDAYEHMVTRGIARALESGTGKELTEALKVAVDWYEMRWKPKEEPGEKWGANLPTAGNGHSKGAAA